jgi:hypothetical protein
MGTRSAPPVRRSIALICLAAGILAILAAGTALSAGSGLSYPSGQKSVSNAEPGRTAKSVGCPNDRPHPTGGGVEVGGDESDLELEVGSSGPTANHGGWSGGANNSSASTAEMTVIAICGHGNYVYKTVKKKIAVGKAVQKKASCPSGTDVVGGGVQAAGDHGVEVGSTEPSDGGDGDSKADDAWLGRESNSSSKKTTMKVTAICAKSGSFTYIRGPKGPVLDDTQATASVSCPPDTQVTGGGVDVTGKNTDIEVADSFPQDDGDVGDLPDNGWSANANNDSSGASESMRAFAICQG